MKTKLLVLLLLAGGSVFARTHVFLGFGVGAPAPVYGYYPGYYPPPPPPVVTYYRPAYPGPGYTWISGYWYPSGPRYAWRAGYWARRPHPRAVWVGPRYVRGRYYRGYWRR